MANNKAVYVLEKINNSIKSDKYVKDRGHPMSTWTRIGG